MSDTPPCIPPIQSKGIGAMCTYCRRLLEPTTARTSETQATRDHVWPIACKVPPTDYDGPRRVWCCFRCNQIKSDMTPEQWSVFMANTPHWWTTPSLASRNRCLKRYYTVGTEPDITTIACVAAIGFWRRITHHSSNTLPSMSPDQ